MSQPSFNPAAREAQKLSRVAVTIAVIALIVVIAVAVFVLVQGFGGTKGQYLVAALPLGLLGHRAER